MRCFVVAFVAACYAASSIASAEVRKWTARAGNFSTEAELVDVSGGNVVLKKRDGNTITVPLDRLSLADVRYVEDFLRQATAAVGKPVGEPDARPAKADKVSASTGKSSNDAGPPLARPNASQWQVHPEAGENVQIRDVSISLPNGFGSGDLLIPTTPSRFIGHVSTGLKPSIQAWDIRSGDRLGPIDIEGHPHPAPALSPDGELLAVFQRSGSKSKLQIWSLKKKTVANEIDLGERGGLVEYLAFAGPRRLIINGGFNQGFRVLDPRSGAEISKIDVKSSSSSQQFAVSPGGTYVVLCDSFNGPLRVYDLRNGEMAGELDANRGSAGNQSFSAMRFSADGQELAALTESPKAALFCWSMKTGKLLANHEFSRRLHELAGGGMHNTALDFIPGGKGWLLGGTAVVDREKGGPIWVAKPASGRDSTFIRMLDGERMLVAFGSPDNRKLSTERLPWNDIHSSAAVVEKGGTAADVGLPPVKKLSSEPGRQLTLSPQAQDWKVIPDAAPTPAKFAEQTILIGPQAIVSEPVLIAPAGPRAIITARGASKSGDPQPRHRFRQFNLKTGKEEGALEPGFAAKALDVNLEGTRLAVIGTPSNDRIDIYDFAGDKHLVGFRPYQGQDSYKSRVHWAALLDDKRLLTLSSDGRLIQWSIPDCKPVYAANLQATRVPALSPSRKHMVVAVEGAYQVLDVATGAPIGSLKLPDLDKRYFLSASEFSSNGKNLAGIFRDASHATLVCWDMTTGDKLHQYDLDAGEDVTWVNDTRLLIHRPRLEDRNLAVGRFPPRRSDLVDLETGRTLWRYQLPVGQFGSSALGGLVWYLGAKDYAQPASLVGAPLPGRETAATMESAPKPQELLPAGTLLTLDVNVSITGDALADKVLQDDVLKKVTEHLTKRGLKVQERSALALRVSLRESLTGRLIELRPILGGVSFRYQVRGKLLTCSLELTDVSRQKLWSRRQTIPVREEIPRTGIPKGTSPDDFVRQQQWTDAMNWVTTGGLPNEIYEGWAYSGMGESILSPSGETLLSLDLPTK